MDQNLQIHLQRITRRILVSAVGLMSIVPLAQAAEPAKPDPYANETPARRDVRMQWRRKARFGMMICWGGYAVPAGVFKDKRGGAYEEFGMYAPLKARR